MNAFSMRNLPMTLLIAGLAMNALDVLTAKGDGGGILFNSTDGFLKGIDMSLPNMDLPGTSIRVNLGGYLIAAGGLWLLGRELT